MRLTAIYNVWSDSVELLEGSINSIRECVDSVIVVVSENSNGFVHDPFAVDVCHELHNKRLIDVLIKKEPLQGKNRSYNETLKRQTGVNHANTLGATHFLLMDSDEYYHSDEFTIAKEIIDETGTKGTVVSLRTYFAEPTLMLAKRENYFVPFIHELNQNTIIGGGSYPFWVDPTRKVKGMSIQSVKHLEFLDMHHFSYVRNDIDSKIQNSTAHVNLNRQKNVIFTDISNAHHTKYSEFYSCPLEEVPDIFEVKKGLAKWKKPIKGNRV